MKHVGISRNRRPEVGVRRLLPLVLQRGTIDGLEAHVGHPARGDVEPRRQGDDVEFVFLAVRRPDAPFGELGDRVARLLADVDDCHVVPVQDLVVVLFEAGPLHAERVRRLRGAEKLPLRRVRDARRLLLAPKVVHAPVGLHVEQVVLVAAEPEAEPLFGPEGFVQGLALLGRVLERVALGKVVGEAGERGLAHPQQFVVHRVQGPLFLGRHVPLAHGQGQVGRALEHGEVLDLGAPFLDDLDARRAGPDDRDLLAAGVDALRRPKGRVVHHALEPVHAGVVGDVPLRGEPGADDEVLASRVAAVGGLDVPLSRVRVELGRSHHAAKRAILAQPQDLVTMVKVCLELVPVRVVGRPRPRLVHLGYGELVYGDLRVHTSA